MAKKKSASQIRRLQVRAEERGEAYVPPMVEETEKGTTTNQETNSPSTKTTPKKKQQMHDEIQPASLLDPKKVAAAMKLQQELLEIQNNETLRAKERRSLKRKAEAIAAEEAKCSTEELEAWCQQHKELLEQQQQQQQQQKDKPNKSKTKHHDDTSSERRKTPYIVFVGQLAYTTTRESLLQHIRKELASDFKNITPESVKIRLLTDPKTKQSRGMAFVELNDPELMYACLRLHHTLLEGRRLNVERSVGGRKPETRKEKIKLFREQQGEYLSNVVDSILQQFIQSGELKPGELDEGAVAMCKRYSAGMVETAIKQYIENNGSTMDNTSAYFSFLLGKLATEKAEEARVPPPKTNKDDNRKRDHNHNHKPPSSKRPKTSDSPKNKPKDKDNDNDKPSTSLIASKSALPNVDFTISEKKGKAKPDMAAIFPSLASRGGRRGRGHA